MSKILSFRGIIADGLEERIKLSTLNGKTGYKITKFQAMANRPGAVEYESTVKIYSKAQGSGSTSIDFSESDLLGACVINDHDSNAYPFSETIIFDNQIFNQDIFISVDSLTGTEPTNYYIELETVTLTDTQATQLTLKSLRNLASR
jgi:hypothetical protein